MSRIWPRGLREGGEPVEAGLSSPSAWSLRIGQHCHPSAIACLPPDHQQQAWRERSHSGTRNDARFAILYGLAAAASIAVTGQDLPRLDDPLPATTCSCIDQTVPSRPYPPAINGSGVTFGFGNSGHARLSPRSPKFPTSFSEARASSGALGVSPRPSHSARGRALGF